MEFYIIDDDFTVIKNLEHIIEENYLGNVIGYSTDGVAGLEDLLTKRPNIVLIDLLMPIKDGIDIVSEIKEADEDIVCIMISQVSAKDMIGKAYNSGIEFFINKPINVIEVTNIIKRVSEKIQMNNTLKKIKNMFNQSNYSPTSDKSNSQIRSIKIVLSRLGILGEKGGKDILDICKYLINTNQRILELNIKDICDTLSDGNPKAMEQRVRRAVGKALSNIASLGIEDYMSDIFTMYSSSIFDFEDVKAEMDYIRGMKKTGGKVNAKKFINNLILYCEI